jgi:phage terminase large subunit
MPKIQVPEKLKRFLTEPKRFKIAFGGRGGSKSNTFADVFLLKSQTEQAKIGCFREMQNSIEDSVHSLLKAEITRLDLQGFTPEKASIYNTQGGEFRFKGLARNPDAVKSMHGFKYFWVEEGQSISQNSIDMLTPTLRETDSELWVSMNLGSSEDPMAKRFITPYWSQLLKDGYYEDDLHLIVWINYPDNPWFPDSLEQERKWDFQNKDRAEYNHIWLGYPNDQVDNSIIRPEWFDAAIDAHKKLGFKPRGVRTVSHDPSDTGDPKGLCYRHG